MGKQKIIFKSNSFITTIFLPGLLALNFVLVSPLMAEDCDVLVRIIKGEGNSEKFGGMDMKVGNYLNDMKSQLETLPYKQYNVLDSKSMKIGLGGKETFQMQDSQKQNHNVIINPLEIKGGRVKLMVDWTDAQGENLLSTQLRVVNGENVVLGTETSGDESTIMSINLDCLE